MVSLGNEEQLMHGTYIDADASLEQFKSVLLTEYKSKDSLNQIEHEQIARCLLVDLGNEFLTRAYRFAINQDHAVADQQSSILSATVIRYVPNPHPITTR